VSIKLVCPGCRKRISAPESLAGKQRECPHCGTLLTIPAAAPPATPSTAAPTSADRPEPKSEPPLILPRSGEQEQLIDMTAMVDIVFFLLIFFLVTSIQALEAVINLPTPQRSTSSSGVVQNAPDYLNDPAYIVVTIDEDDTIWVDDEEVFGEQNLRARLRAARAESAECNGLLVIGSPDATHGTLVSVLDAGADAGLTELLFSVSEQADSTGG